MPKENTHIYFADRVVKNLDQKIAMVIQDSLDCFYLGSVFPDTFFYSQERVNVADRIHGYDGKPTNELIVCLLENAKEKRCQDDLVFSLGLLTHFCLDIVFHPVINSLIGDTYDKDLKKRSEANFLHRKWETQLDQYLNDRFYFQKFIRCNLVTKLFSFKVIQKEFFLSLGVIEKTLRRQFQLNGLFLSRAVYNFLWLINKVGIYSKKEDLGLFYAIVDSSEKIDFEKINYVDFWDGNHYQISVWSMLDRALDLACFRLQSSFDFYQGRIAKEELKQAVRGESLESGKEF